MNDYARIAKVIRYLDACHSQQPDLVTVADLLGLSPFHFHRLFKHWAGITPKAFVQCLTLEEAKRSLQEGSSVLEATLDAGLSGPGRLHDLCVKLSAATPGEIKSGGRGLDLRYGIGETPFGPCLIARTNRGVCHLAFLDSADIREEIALLQSAWPQAKLQRDDAHAAEQLGTAFPLVVSKSAPITLWVRGTDFQLRVWRALLALPPGRLVSYGQLAQAIDQPTAARAVGTAVGANPLAFLIPCHRVIRETGVVGHYRWGHGRKRTLIAWERALQLTADQH